MTHHSIYKWRLTVGPAIEPKHSISHLIPSGRWRRIARIISREDGPFLMDGTTHSNIDQAGAKSSLTPDETVRPLRLYRQMGKIRLFEEQVNDLYRSARMPGLAHLYIGEEGVAVGIC